MSPVEQQYRDDFRRHILALVAAAVRLFGDDLGAQLGRDLTARYGQRVDLAAPNVTAAGAGLAVERP